MQALGVLVDGRLRADVLRYSGEVELIVLPAPNSLAVQPTDFDHSEHLGSEASAASRKALAGAAPPHGHLSILSAPASELAYGRAS
jgi:hypothetical protein